MITHWLRHPEQSRPAGPVLVVGSSGRVGQALLAGVPGPFREFDLPRHDARDPVAVASAAEGCSQIVLLAWNLTAENHDNGGSHPGNQAMVKNVLDVAVRLGTLRVVLASSVHAGALARDHRVGRMVAPTSQSRPATPYGESKRALERLGRQAATSGVDVIAIRFGGVGWPRPNRGPERRRWLHAVDFRNLMTAVLDGPVRPGRFALCYGVSRNVHRQVSLRNHVGWRPLWMPAWHASTYPDRTANPQASGRGAAQ